MRVGLAELAEGSSALRHDTLESRADRCRVWLWVPTVAACAAGFTIVYIDRPGSEDFSDLPQFKVWATIIAIQAGIWFLVAAQSSLVCARLRGRFRTRAGLMPLASWAILVGLIVVAYVVVLSNVVSSPLHDRLIKMLSLTVLGLVAATPAVVGIWYLQLVSVEIRAQITYLTKGAAWSADHQSVFQGLCDIRKALQTLLSGLGAIVAVLTLSNGALRNAIIAWRAAAPERTALFPYPIEYLVIYGLFFTALVALIYVPAFAAMESAGAAFVETIYPVPSDEVPTAEWEAGRNRLSKLLHLGIRAEDSLRSGVAIFAPLLATLVAAILPGSK